MLILHLQPCLGPKGTEEPQPAPGALIETHHGVAAAEAQVSVMKQVIFRAEVLLSIPQLSGDRV